MSKNIPARNEESHAILRKDKKTLAKSLESVKCEAKMLTV
jgi:hypothetical protein